MGFLIYKISVVSIAKNSFIAVIFNAITLFLSFATNLVIAAKFGSGFDMDIYFTATTIPTYLITIIAGVLGITFIPIFSGLKEENVNQAWKIVSIFFNLSTALCILILVLGLLFSDTLIQTIAPGFPVISLEYASEILTILLPTVLISVILELVNSIYFAHYQFSTPLFIRAIGPALLILFIFIFEKAGITAIAFASLFSSFIQLVIILLHFRSNSAFHFKFVPIFYSKEINSIVKVMFPLIIGMTVYKITPMIDRYFLSSLKPGSISYVNYASKLFLAISQIIASSISTTSFPILSKYASESSTINEFRTIFNKIIRTMFFITIPIVFFIIINSELIIQLIFERGKFTSYDTISVAKCLSIYILVLPLSTVGTIISQGFYAFKNTIVPVIIGFFEIALYILLSFFLVNRLGFISIPIIYFSYFLFSVLCLSIILQKRIKWCNAKQLIYFIGKIFCISLISSIPMIVTSFLTLNILFSFISICFSFLLFFRLSFIYRVEELNIFKSYFDGIVKKIKR